MLIDNEDEQTHLSVESACSCLDFATALVSGHDNGLIMVWDLETKQKKRLQMTETITKVKFSNKSIVCLIKKLGTFYKIDQSMNVTM